MRPNEAGGHRAPQPFQSPGNNFPSRPKSLTPDRPLFLNPGVTPATQANEAAIARIVRIRTIVVDLLVHDPDWK
jgi:hypothetical protein